MKFLKSLFIAYFALIICWSLALCMYKHTCTYMYIYRSAHWKVVEALYLGLQSGRPSRSGRRRRSASSPRTTESSGERWSHLCKAGMGKGKGRILFLLSLYFYPFSSLSSLSLPLSLFLSIYLFPLSIHLSIYLSIYLPPFFLKLYWAVGT